VALQACVQRAQSVDSNSAHDTSQCAEADSLVQEFTALRMLAVAGVVSWRVAKLFRATEGPNIFERFVNAGCYFAEHEGLGMLLYFSISFALDSGTIFLAPSVGSYCEADKLAALYTAALVTFLPNAFYALYLQGTYWDNGRTLARVGFVMGAILLTSVSFCLRLLFVFDAGWISIVQHIMSSWSVTRRAAFASAIPPMVDVIQSVILIGVTHIKSAPAAANELLPSHVDDSACHELSEEPIPNQRSHILGGVNPTLLQGSSNSPKKNTANGLLES